MLPQNSHVEVIHIKGYIQKKGTILVAAEYCSGGPFGMVLLVNNRNIDYLERN